MIAIIDYGAGNTASVANAVEELKTPFVITDKESVISRSDKIIFPGVGQAKSALKNLHPLNLISLLGMIKIPLLGICLGMQLLAEKSAEGNVVCLGNLSGSSEKFNSEKVTVPHMGWSKVFIKKANRLFEGIPDLEYFYFAHSYYLPVNDYTIAAGDHGGQFSAAVQKDNFYGVQFHPEKSGKWGLFLLNNFIEKC